MRAGSKPESRVSMGWVGSGADGGFTGLLDSFEDSLCAPGKAVDLALAAGAAEALRVVLVEGRVDAAQNGFERNASFAPCLNQRPVEG